jgi:hypothetical protein
MQAGWVGQSWQAGMHGRAGRQSVTKRSQADSNEGTSGRQEVMHDSVSRQAGRAVQAVWQAGTQVGRQNRAGRQSGSQAWRHGRACI